MTLCRHNQLYIWHRWMHQLWSILCLGLWGLVSFNLSRATEISSLCNILCTKSESSTLLPWEPTWYTSAATCWPCDMIYHSAWYTFPLYLKCVSHSLPFLVWSLRGLVILTSDLKTDSRVKCNRRPSLDISIFPFSSRDVGSGQRQTNAPTDWMQCVLWLNNNALSYTQHYTARVWQYKRTI